MDVAADLLKVTVEAMDQMAEMGMVEGMTQAMGQMDALLEEQTARP